MKSVKVEDYNGQGLFTKFVILSGNTADNYGRAEVKTLEKSYMQMHPAFKETYWGSRNYKLDKIAASEVIALRSMPDEPTKFDDFDRHPVSVIRPSYEQIVVLQNEDDKEGTLLEEGDVILISEKTQRDNSSGKDTLQVKALAKADFETIYQRVDRTYFRPQFNVGTHGLRGSNKLAALFGASLAKQFESIKNFDEKSFKAHFQDIKTQLESEFEATLHNKMKNALLSGKDISAYNDILTQTKQEIAQGCEEQLSDDYNDEYVLYVIRKLFRDEKFAAELEGAQGAELLNKVVDDWATIAETKALNPSDTRVPQNVMNPAALFNMHAAKKGKDLSAYALIASGSVDILTKALKAKMKPHLTKYFEEQTKGYTTYNLPVIGERNKRKGLERFLSAVGC